jgi:nucleoside-diphosphate-sugar epimerase
MEALPPLFKNDLDHVLEQTRSLWNEWGSSKFFISGGTGFFGTWLTESWCWARSRLNLANRLTILTRDPDRFRARSPHLALHPGVDLIRGDVRRFDCPKGTYDLFVHAATPANARFNQESPVEMLDTIVDGARNMLAFADSRRAEAFLFTSSGAVYGPQPSYIENLPESYRGDPNPQDSRNAYAEGKRVAESLCLQSNRAHAMETKIARCFAFVGPHLPLNEHFAIGNFIRDALSRRTIQVAGDGSTYRSYMYGADLSIWLWTILKRGAKDKAYNVGSEKAMTIRQVAESVAASAGGLQVQIASEPDPNKLPLRYVPDTNLCRSELGLREIISVQDAITRTLKWHSLKTG